MKCDVIIEDYVLAIKKLNKSCKLALLVNDSNRSISIPVPNRVKKVLLLNTLLKEINGI
jgi:hypothetical protein